MAKADAFVSPANLWGKPLPGSTNKVATKNTKKEKATGMPIKDEDYDDVEDDVEAELEEDAPVTNLDEVDDEEAYVEADATDEEEEDETEYAPEAGDDEDEVEVTVESADDVDATVDADEDVSEEATPVNSGSKKKVRDMAVKMSGADHVRDEIARRQAAGDSLRGVDIVAALAKRRIAVSPAQVSQLLKKAAGPTKKRTAAAEEKSFVTAKVGRKTAEAEQSRKAPRLPAATAPRPASRPALPMTQIKAASAFLETCDGCYTTAAEILSAHKQLATEFGG